jgi:hypothetical protein
VARDLGLRADAGIGFSEGCLRRRVALGAHERLALKDQSLAGNTTYQEAASQVVSAILADAAADASGRTGQTLSDVLPRLAEAAPSEFLDEVLDDFDTTSPLLRTTLALAAVAVARTCD